MNKRFLIGAAALALSALVPADVALAQDDNGSGQQGQQLPPPPMMQRLHNGLDQGLENAQNNRDARNAMMGGRMMRSASGTPMFASGTPMMWWQASSSPFRHRGPGRGGEGTSTEGFPPFTGRMMDDLGSSTDLQGHEGWQNARLDMFVFMQGKLVEQLTRALDNLVQIRGRIAARIQADASTSDMTGAESLLAAADLKLAAAKSAIQALASFAPTATSTQLTATTTVGLGKPRQIGGSAIQAMNDARKALNDVVVAIAHSMGDQEEHADASSTDEASSSQDR
jgi:hypothetical protein